MGQGKPYPDQPSIAEMEAERKAAPTPAGWTAQNIGGKTFEVKDSQGQKVGTLLANNADEAVRDLARDLGGQPALVEAANAAKARSRAAGAALDAFPKGAMGLTTDAAKATPEWKAARKEMARALAAERAANAAVLKARKAKPAAPAPQTQAPAKPRSQMSAKELREAEKAKAAPQPQADRYDGMELEDLRIEGRVRGIKTARSMGAARLKVDLRAQDKARAERKAVNDKAIEAWR